MTRGYKLAQLHRNHMQQGYKLAHVNSNHTAELQARTCVPRGFILAHACRWATSSHMHAYNHTMLQGFLLAHVTQHAAWLILVHHPAGLMLTMCSNIGSFPSW